MVIETMFKSVFRVVLKSLVLFLLFNAPTSCSKASAITDEKEATVQKPAKITAMFDIIVKTEDGQQKLIEEYKKQTGIELIITQPPHNQYTEKVKLAFSSNSIPDIVEVGNSDYVNLSEPGAKPAAV